LARLINYKKTNGKTTQKLEVVDKMKSTISSCLLVDFSDWNVVSFFRKVYFTHLPGSPPWRDLHKILHDGSPRRRN